jgi:hypothetical protein
MTSNRIHLRRFESQLIFDTAFQYYDVRGTLMEKWGYRQGFDQHAITPDDAQVNGSDESTLRVAKLQPKLAAFLTEGITWTDSADLSTEWWSDVCLVLQPRLLRRLLIRWVHAVSLTSQAQLDKANERLLRIYPNVITAAPNWPVRNPGVSFNSSNADETQHTSMSMGAMLRDQRENTILMHKVRSDTQFMYGLAGHYSIQLDISSQKGAAERLAAEVAEAKRLANTYRNDVLAKVFPDG